jgi:hypothetical protein
LKLTNDGLSLWYCTPDAPTPFDDEVVPREGASLVIAVQPANPTNTLSVRFRVDGGLVQTASGREIRTDYDRNVQYFAVSFPAFVTGELVEYAPVLTCGGRQCPPAHLAERFRSRFRLEAQKARPKEAARTKPPLQGAHYDSGLEPVGTVALQFAPPQYVGETPWGMRVNLIVRDSAVAVKGFVGKMLEASMDGLLVRRDGMGVVRLRSVIALDEGAVLDVESGGYVDFGPDGYRRAVAHDLPDRSSVVVSPLITTRHPKYSWLGRLQCIGVGYTHLDVGQALYDVYAVKPRALTRARG